MKNQPPEKQQCALHWEYFYFVFLFKISFDRTLSGLKQRVNRGRNVDLRDR